MAAGPEKSGSRLEKVLRAGHFAVTAELGPPKSADGEVVARKARTFAGFGDAFNITDNQTAIVRMTPLAAGALALQSGVEPIMQMTCRDRNRMALQSDLLGASALGIKNILCMKGDPGKIGNHPDAKEVFDLDTMDLIRMAVKMRDEKKFLCGDDMKVAPRMMVGATENPFIQTLEERVKVLGFKVDAGADFIQTQMVFNVPRFASWMELVRKAGRHAQISLLAGVGVLKSAKMTRHMRDNVPGMDVPDAVLARIEAAEAKGEAAVQEEGIAIAVEVIQELKKIEGVAGVHVMAVNWEEAVPEVVKRAGLHPRPAV